MRAVFSRQFKQEFKKLSPTQKIRVRERLELFLSDPQDPRLRDHGLHGQYKGYRSINATGDIRIIYEKPDKQTVLFMKMGTHSKLYGE